MAGRSDELPGTGPLYRRVAARLQELTATLPPGERLPTEPKLAATLGVSRVTLRKALELLIEDGLVVRQHGVGTFVAPARMVEPLVGLHSMRDLAAAYSATYEVEIEDREVAPATAVEQHKLELEPGARVLRYKRRDIIDGQPICLVRVTLRADYADRLDAEALRAHSAYRLLEVHYGVRIVRAFQTIRADAADESLVGALRVPAGFPVLVVNRIGYGDDDTPLEWGRLSYRHDRVECSVALLRQSQSAQESARDLTVRYSSRPK